MIRSYQVGSPELSRWYGDSLLQIKWTLSKTVGQDASACETVSTPARVRIAAWPARNSAGCATDSIALIRTPDSFMAWAQECGPSPSYDREGFGLNFRCCRAIIVSVPGHSSNYPEDIGHLPCARQHNLLA